MYPKNNATPERIAVGSIYLIADGTIQTSGASVRVRPQGGADAAGGNSPEYDTTSGVIFYTPTQAETNYTSFCVTVYKASCTSASVTIVTSATAVPGTVDVGEISGDSTAADNLELQYDGTGLSGDNYPSTQSQISGLVVTGSPVNVACKAEPNGFVLTTGNEDANNEDSTRALDGTRHELSDDGGTLDAYYKFDLGGDGLPGSVTITGRFNGGNDDFGIYANKGASGTPVWEQIGILEGTNSVANASHTFEMLSDQLLSDVVGEAWVRVYSAALTSCTFDVDQIFISKSVVNRTVGYANGAIWVDTNASNDNENTEVYVDGTADNPVSTWAAALTLSASLSMKRFQIRNGSTITLSDNSDGFSLLGMGWALDLNGKSIEGAYVEGATVSGIGVTTTTRPRFEKCGFGNVTLGPCILRWCGLGGTFTGGSKGQYAIVDCVSMVAGSGSPTLTFSGLGASSGINTRRWAGGATYVLDSDCTLSHEVLAGGGTTVTTGGADVEIRGITRSITLTLSGAGTVQFVGTTGPIAISGTATTTVNLYGGSSAVTDTSVNTTVNDHTAAGPDVHAILADTNELQGDWVDGGRLDLILDDVPNTAEFGARTLATADYFDASTDEVTPTAASKTGYALSSTGLDSITATRPAGVASTFPQMLVQLWSRFFGKTTLTATELKTYAANGTDVITTQTVSDNDTIETQGESS